MKLAERDEIWSRGGAPVEELPDPFAPVPPIPDREGVVPSEQPKRRRWPYVLYGVSGLVLFTLAWLVVTAPLSRALEPLPNPAPGVYAFSREAVQRNLYRIPVP